MGLCECGCGKEANLGRRFIRSHHLRLRIGDRHPNWGKKKPHKEETKIKIGKANKNKVRNEEARKRISEAQIGRIPWNMGLTKETSSGVHKISESKLGDKNPMKRPEVRLKMIQSKLGHAVWNKGLTKETSDGVRRTAESKIDKPRSIETREKLKVSNREATKKMWQDSEYVEKIRKAWDLKPTKPEKFIINFLDIHFPNEWKYVGDFQVWFGGKNPDFLNVNGKKKIIEFFGEFWHKKGDEEDRIEHFKQYGFDTLVLWQEDLSDESFLVSKIKNFMEGGL